MTDEELKELVASIAVSVKKLEEDQEKTARTVRQTNKQLGELGRKLGGYTEGLAEQSLKKIFSENFKLEFSAKNVRRRKNGSNIELDFFGYSNSTENKAFVAEIKSTFGEEDFEQVMQTLQDFPKFFPEHSDKKLYAIVAAVSIPENLRNKLWRNGIYLAVLSREVFDLLTPPDFNPKQFNSSLN